MNRLDEIKNKYDFLFGQGNPETDAVADADTSWLINRVEKLEGALKWIEENCLYKLTVIAAKKALEGDS